MIEDSLKIEYSSTHELAELFKAYPKQAADIYNLYAKALRLENDLTTELAILTSEIVSDIVEKRNIPPSARQEIRRSEVPNDKRWQKIQRKLNKAIENTMILNGAVNGMYAKKLSLEYLGKLELKIMFGDPTIYRDNRNPDTKVRDLEKYIDLPGED